MMGRSPRLMNWCSENKSLNETYKRERRERSIDDLEYWHKVHDRVLENTGDPARAVRVADKRTYDLRY